MIQKVKMFLLEAWAKLTCVNCSDARNCDAGLWLREYMAGPYRGWHKRFYFPKGTYKFFTKADMPKDAVIYCFGDIVSHGGVINIQGGTLYVYGTIGKQEPQPPGYIIITGNVTGGRAIPMNGIYSKSEKTIIADNVTMGRTVEIDDGNLDKHS